VLSCHLGWQLGNKWFAGSAHPSARFTKAIAILKYGVWVGHALKAVFTVILIAANTPVFEDLLKAVMTLAVEYFSG